MSVLLKNGNIMSNEELFALPVDGDGWRLLHDGNRVSIGNGASIGSRASIGNGARIGEWARIGDGASIKISPLAVQGTGHLVTQHSKGKISVGCKVHTHEIWLGHYKEIGKNNGYTPEQIKEYGKILRFVIDNGVEIGVVEETAIRPV